jgi:hypothetical protein
VSPQSHADKEGQFCTNVYISLGVGAPLPEKAADGSWNRKELSSNDILRKQLLGRNYEKVMKAKEADAKALREKNAAANAAASGSAPTAAADVEDEDDDEEEGRAATVGKRRKMNSSSSRAVPSTSTTVSAENGAAGDALNGEQSLKQTKAARGRKKATSYLDEILAQRASKKKKR